MVTKIFIDQAHNPSGTFDSGLFLNGVAESNVVYNIGIDTAGFFRTHLFDVRLSRPTPETIIGTDTATSIMDRINMANEWRADLFLCLHCNSSPDTRVFGTEMHIRRLYDVSDSIANSILQNVVRLSDIKNNGVHVIRSYTLDNVHMPAVLIAVGYLSNPMEARRINDRTFQHRYAQGIYRGLVEHYILP
jgi:N-acetylmuramoyl-L-alanine amidase